MGGAIANPDDMTKIFASRGFSIAAPSVWNSLL